MIGQIIGGIFAIAKGWFAQKKAEQQTRLAVEQNRARMAADTAQYNSAWELAEITQSDKWLRRISFTMFSMPFLIAIFKPELVSAYFSHALSAMPEWYVKAYLGITGAVWGISSLKNTIIQIIGRK